MNTQTMPAPVSDERVLDQLEAEFLRGPWLWTSLSETDAGVAEMLAPAAGRADATAFNMISRVRTRVFCCDRG
jgi:hypothetical protein